MTRNPIIVGTVLAAVAALAFGITTPFIQRFGAGVGAQAHSHAHGRDAHHRHEH